MKDKAIKKLKNDCEMYFNWILEMKEKKKEHWYSTACLYESKLEGESYMILYMLGSKAFDEANLILKTHYRNPIKNLL